MILISNKSPSYAQLIVVYVIIKINIDRFAKYNPVFFLSVDC